MSLPVYFVGPVGGDQDKYKLFREFVRQDLPTGATPAAKAKAALVLAINAQPYSNTDGYLQPWSGQTIGDVTVADGVITVDLANGGAPEAVVGDENKRLAVQELVWTAQAAIQQTLPVRFEVADGSTKLFGSISTDQDFTRPPSDRVYEDLAPVWVTSPSRDQVLPAAQAGGRQGPGDRLRGHRQLAARPRHHRGGDRPRHGVHRRTDAGRVLVLARHAGRR